MVEEPMIGWAMVLTVAAEVLDRVDLRGVGRQPLDLDAPAPGLPQPNGRGAVGGEPVPDQDEWPGQMSPQVAKEHQQFALGDVLVWMLMDHFDEVDL